jgi:hypothetical protein
MRSTSWPSDLSSSSTHPRTVAVFPFFLALPKSVVICIVDSPVRFLIFVLSKLYDSSGLASIADAPERYGKKGISNSAIFCNRVNFRLKRESNFTD